MRFSRETLFKHMLVGEACLLYGFPQPAQGEIADLPAEDAGMAIMQWLASRRSKDTHRVFAGPTGVRRELTLQEIAKKWHANRTRFGVTDLHIRESNMEEVIAPDILSEFNLLRLSNQDAKDQEMFSFVISSRGQVTDSHSDAPDSSNYCFTGQKYWLIWDTYEGAKCGLQDVDRVAVAGKASFDMKRWLSLPSARWVVVNPGQTLFLPANFTHKVITLERYIGVGGFYIALPNCLRLMNHWITRGPLWLKRDRTGALNGLLGDIAQSIHDTILDLRDAPRNEREKFGYDYLDESAKAFIETCPKDRLSALYSDQRFRCIADLIEAPWPGQLQHAV